MLSISELSSLYRSNVSTPEAVIKSLYPKLESSHATFIHLEPLDRLIMRCKELELIPAAERGELWGIPFAAKDNVDAAGLPTTAACPTFSYMPGSNAPALQALLDAGAILVGKTNMDQFAAGLVGCRSPYGVPRNAADPRFVPGGSSSGSATAVSSGLVCFALGTDTAGSGRIPAGLNGCVGIKGTVGSISTVGVVPACASIDCLTCFASSVDDGARVMRIMAKGDAGPKDVWRRRPPHVGFLSIPPETGFRFAVPSREFLDWSCSGAKSLIPKYQAEFDLAVERLVSIGGIKVEINFDPLLKTAALLYGSSFVAERYSGIRNFLEAGKQSTALVIDDERLMPVTRHIIAGSSKFSAADVFDDLARLAVLRAESLHEISHVDLLLVPTALAHFTVEEVTAEESGPNPMWTMNAKLGRSADS